MIPAPGSPLNIAFKIKLHNRPAPYPTTAPNVILKERLSLAISDCKRYLDLGSLILFSQQERW